LHPAKTRHGNDLVFVRNYQKWKNLLNIVKIPKKLPKHLLIFLLLNTTISLGGWWKKEKVKKLKNKNSNWIWIFVISEKSAEAEQILSSPNFFKLLTTFPPLERFLADSILLGGT
jgi:hypothetical protein